MEGESTNETGEKEVFVWRENHDIFLLREVLTLEPYKYRFGSKERGSTWTSIAGNLEGFGMKVSQRSVRERFTRMMDAFKKKEAAEKRATGVDVDYTEKDKALLDIMERMAECEEVSEQEKQKDLQEKETAEEMRRRAVERLGETRKRGNSDKEDGGTPDGKRKRSGEMVEVLKESIKATREKEEAERELRERDMQLREQQLAMQQQFQQSLLEQQQQFQVQQQAMTMAFVNAMTELVKNINK